MTSTLQSFCADDVIITDELEGRPSRAPDHEAESRALRDLAETMATKPDDVLQHLVEVARALTSCGSVGISLLEPGGEHGTFRWVATTGAWGPYLNGRMPREASPCGAVIERNTLLLMKEPERAFPALLQAEPGIGEGLLAPFHVDGEAVGTVWAIKHDPDDRFEREDARLLQSLSRFAAAAHQMTAALHGAQARRRESEVREEVTRRESAERLAAELAGTQQKLSTRLIPEQSAEVLHEQILNAALELMGADAVSIQLLEDGGQRLRRVATLNLHSASTEYWTWVDASHSSTCGQALRTNTRVVAEDVEASAELAGTGDLEAFRASGTRAVQSIPLVSRSGRPIGMISTHRRRPRRLIEGDFGLFDILARQVADLLERSQSEAALRASEERQAFLLRLSDDIRAQPDEGAIGAFVTRCLTEHLRLDRSYVARLYSEEDRVFVGPEYRRPDLGPASGEYRLSDFPEVVRQVHKKTVVINDVADDPALTGSDRSALSQIDIGAVVTAGVRESDERVVWALTVTSTGPRAWTPDEVLLVENTAERTWAAIERVRAEAALRASEERFRTLAESIEDVFYITDLDRNALLYLSPAYETLWGRPTADLHADLNSFVETIHPEDRARFLEGKAVQERGEPVVIEYRIVLPDGTLRWVFDRSFPISDAGGRRSAGVASDITTRKRAEAGLREAEGRFRAIVESARDYAIFTTDVEGRIASWPPGAETVFGWSETEAAGQYSGITFTPEDRAGGEPEKELETARQAELAPDVRWHLRKDGVRIFVEGSTRPLRGPDGSVTGFLKIGQDVTERRATERALAESEERFRQFADASSDVLWIRNADTLQFEYVGPAFERIYGDSFERTLAGNDLKRWLELIVPDDRDAVLESFRRVRAGERVTHEFRIIRPSDGEVRWIRNSDFPLRDASGQVHRIGGIGHDATEEKATADRMQVMVAELQHRTRNLMGVVRSLVDNTLRGSRDLEDFKFRLKDRLAALARVQGLLSRLDESDRVTFDQLISAEISALGGDTSRVTLEGPPGVALRSSTVQTFAMALHELATNAVKYGALKHANGKLVVRWWLDPPNGGPPLLHVDWRETGLQVLARQDRAADAGSGRRLIERALPYQLGAKTNFSIGPDGVHCTIAVPVSEKGGPGPTYA